MKSLIIHRIKNTIGLYKSIPDEDWQTAVTTPSNQDALDSFIQSNDITNLFVYTTKQKLFEVYLSWPDNCDRGAVIVYTLKQTKGPIIDEGMVRSLIIGSCINGDQENAPLSVLLNEVLLPFFSCPDNFETWAAALIEEMRTKSFNLSVSRLTHDYPKVESLSLLSKVHSGDNNSFQTKFYAEKMISIWSKIYDSILKTFRPSECLETDDVQALYHMWSLRKESLDLFYTKLLSSNSQEVLNILRASKSPYLDEARDLFSRVHHEWQEASEAAAFLKPLTSFQDYLEANFISLTEANFRQFIDSLLILKKRKKFVNLENKILLCYTSAFITTTKKFINTSGLASLEEDEASQVFNNVENTITVYLKVLEGTSASIEFQIDKLTLLTPLKSLSKSVGLLKCLVTKRFHFDFSEKIEFSGIAGRKLTPEIKALLESMVVTISTVLDTSTDYFTDEFEIAAETCHQTVDIDELKVERILRQAYDGCSSLDHMSKFLLGNGPLLSALDRAISLKGSFLEHFINSMSEELTCVENLCASPGMKQFTRNCTTRNASRIKLFSELYARILFNRQLMNQTLQEQLENAVCEWSTDGHSLSVGLLNQVIFKRLQTSSNLVEVNLSPRLKVVLHEVKFVLSLGFNLSQNAVLEVYNNSALLHQLWIVSMQIRNSHNWILENCPPELFALIQGEMNLITDALQTLNKIFGIIEDLRERTKFTLECLDNIIAEISPARQIEVFQRKDSRRENLFVIQDSQEALRKRQAVLTKANLNITQNLQMAGTSLECIITELSPSTSQGHPVYEIVVDLKGNNMRMEPELSKSSANGLYSMVDNIISELFEQRKLIEISQIKLFVEGEASIVGKQANIMSLLEAGLSKAEEELNSLQSYFRLLDDVPVSQMAEEIEQDDRAFCDRLKNQLSALDTSYNQVSAIVERNIYYGWLSVDLKRLRNSLLNSINTKIESVKKAGIEYLTEILLKFNAFIQEVIGTFENAPEEGDYQGLIKVLEILEKVKRSKGRQELLITIVEELEVNLGDVGGSANAFEQVKTLAKKIPDDWSTAKKRILDCRQRIIALQNRQIIIIREESAVLEHDQHLFQGHLLKSKLFEISCPNPYDIMDQMEIMISEFDKETKRLFESSKIFDISMSENTVLLNFKRQLRGLKSLWDLIISFQATIEAWKETLWVNVNIEMYDMLLREYLSSMQTLFEREHREWILFIDFQGRIRNLMTSMHALTDLQNIAIQPRHWRQLANLAKISFEINDQTRLADLLSLGLHKFEEEIKELVEKATKESEMEKFLRELEKFWRTASIDLVQHERTQCMIVKMNDEVIESLEENQSQIQTLLYSKFVAFFHDQLKEWQVKLANVEIFVTLWMDVQKIWSKLESIFTLSDDIKKKIPSITILFKETEEKFLMDLGIVSKERHLVRVSDNSDLIKHLHEYLGNFEVCENALAEYLESKRLLFPRFYFLSSMDLIDLLSNGTNPDCLMKHLCKLFDSIQSLEISQDNSNLAINMTAKDGENVTFLKSILLHGEVEVILNMILDEMRSTLKGILARALICVEEQPRDLWIESHPSQICLTALQIVWANEVEQSFTRLQEGYVNSMKDLNKKQIAQINALITILLTNIGQQLRQKIMTICTLDVHNRDVVAKLVAKKIEISESFVWQSQLRHKWNEKENLCYVSICDARFDYLYEYLGNTPRLVITPLTDKCYITLTQSLNLYMSAAPAGPAGTGKTETTKDLGKALGVLVNVFNCSEQMDYKSVGNIFKGLAQSGIWGCFDEFNRISIEVLSVVAVQVKTIQDALKNKRKEMNFLGEQMKILPSVGIFITMNPGYAGRTELPENLKALFRPCAMVLPDFELICEIMLIAEGFLTARVLAKKFLTLYRLCKDLLSKQDHYDWGLRAIKSVLVVAGSLKRSDPDRSEDQVLMRALRDFNTPKIVNDDLPIFLGLIGDLFVNIQVSRKVDDVFEADLRQVAISTGLQPEEMLILKTVQLKELLDVRYSVFILGNAGTGKSKIWTTLYNYYLSKNLKAMAVDLSPKAVGNDELFGMINPATREWKDGLFSNIMRQLAYTSHDDPKWMILDGDIDPMWIENLNTVMDDNKILTLANNERIPLTKSMRLLFEISHLKTATPATVSRAGILYLNDGDLNWTTYSTHWLMHSKYPKAIQSMLMILFEKYFTACLEAVKSGQQFETITPMVDVNYIQTLCILLDDCLCNIKQDQMTKEVVEMIFVFSVVWTFGGSLVQDGKTNAKHEFSKWFLDQFKSVKLPPDSETIFGVYFDRDQLQLTSWDNKMIKFEFDSDIPVSTMVVPTRETIQLNHFINIFINSQRPVMLVGNSGFGKSLVMQNSLDMLSPDEYGVVKVPFNFYTSHDMIQSILERPLEKKSGRNYAPFGNKKLIYFLDDINMAEEDKYFTVTSHQILRQHLDYSHWYDRTSLGLKNIQRIQFVACMNPTAGNFTIDPRLQRHFSVFSIGQPCKESFNSIFSQILARHLSLIDVPTEIQLMVGDLVSASLHLYNLVLSKFITSVEKFHYLFNLRDLSNVFQGILLSSRESLSRPLDLLMLWTHECFRVYTDKFSDLKDVEIFTGLLLNSLKTYFDEASCDAISRLGENIQFLTHSSGSEDAYYQRLDDSQIVHNKISSAMASYNETVSSMDLVLFDQAVKNILRISRILQFPTGNAVLIGVGGSGKQSLAKLAAFMNSMNIFQISIKKNYSLADFTADMAEFSMKATTKNLRSILLLTDNQIVDEKFLVIINDFLATGEVNGLLTDDQTEAAISSVRLEVKASGLIDSRENCWNYFTQKLRKNLRLVICTSPVGERLKRRCRKFPALINCTSLIWFHPWSEAALESVANSLLAKSHQEPQELSSISRYLSYAHKSTQELAHEYSLRCSRFVCVTPKTFLLQIQQFEMLLHAKHQENEESINRFTSGLTKLKETAEEVAKMQEKLVIQEAELKVKSDEVNGLLEKVSLETQIVNAEKRNAELEKQKVAEIKKEVSSKQRECEKDLEKAKPALVEAQEALNTLNKNNLTEMKSFGTPPAQVIQVAGAVMCLMAPKGKIPKDRSWKAAKATIMSKIDQFLDNLINYDKENIHEASLVALKPYLEDPEFRPELIKAKSSAASGLCSWVINIVKFYEIYCEVKPKQEALDAANQELRQATETYENVQRQIQELEEKLAVLTSEFERSSEEKRLCQEEAEKTEKITSMANRLINGLASERERWTQLIEDLTQQKSLLLPTSLISAAFLNYCGPFPKEYRIRLVADWRAFLANQFVGPNNNLPEFSILSLLVDEFMLASWDNEGLPNDTVSIENAAITMQSQRWPLLIDPQFQASKWIKSKYKANLVIIQASKQGYIDCLERAIEDGHTVLLEDVEEEIDCILDDVICRVTLKNGRVMRIGDREISYNPKFRLILQTKLSNPHFKPELQAQTTLIDFSVTKIGLEDQLLASIVAIERPDLEKERLQLRRQQNDFRITLKSLEDSLLAQLSNSTTNILENYELVENLELSKKTATEIEVKMKTGKQTEVSINKARSIYTPIVRRCSIIYFIMRDLHRLKAIYQFSLKAYRRVFSHAIKMSPPNDDELARVSILMDSLTHALFAYTCRGLFTRDKIIFTCQLMFDILLAEGRVTPDDVKTFLNLPKDQLVDSPVDFLSSQTWSIVKSLSSLESFKNLDLDIQGSPKQWKKIFDSEVPEDEKLPQDWKNKTELIRLAILRALRPDRTMKALLKFIETNLGQKFVSLEGVPLMHSFLESSSQIPLFFVLSPGVNPIRDVEVLGRELGFSEDNQRLHNISLGQGQEILAENAIRTAKTEGHWVILQNIHLVRKWLATLNQLLHFEVDEDIHENFRVFLSAEPSDDPQREYIPQGLLEDSIKMTNEPPSGLKANIHRALSCLDQSLLDSSTKDNEFKSILFSLCYFHAVISERRKFGSQGWNRVYPFNNGDLVISTNVLFNYLESNVKVPWEDLKFLFGEIMYGGHITDEWDRRLCHSYLEDFLSPSMLDGEFFIVPGFKLPTNSDLTGYHDYVDHNLPSESPALYKMSQNSEFEFLTKESQSLCTVLLEMQAASTTTTANSSSADSTDPLTSVNDRMVGYIDEILEKIPQDSFNLQEIKLKLPPSERSPFSIVMIQECYRMNLLTDEIKTSLSLLKQGLNGELTLTEDLEAIITCMILNKVPVVWEGKAYPSLMPLSLWLTDLVLRLKELENFVASNFNLPNSVWMSGLFNPQSFLTSILQTASRKNNWELDQIKLSCDITKKSLEELSTPPREGNYIHGVYLEGARWDHQVGCLADEKFREACPQLPIIHLRVVPNDPRNDEASLNNNNKGLYICPLYRTKIRGQTIIWVFSLKTRVKSIKWILNGVAMILQI